jgi:hypothetical protein
MIQPSRPLSSLSEPITQKLNAYALAAGAAGVGMLALAHPAEARIVYTPANIPINVNGALVDLDLNHDGINDFVLAAGYSGPGIRHLRALPPEGQHASSLGVTPAQPSNRVWAMESQNHLCAVAAPKGERVGPHRRFQPGNSLLVMAFASGNSTHGAAFCPWRATQESYVGLKFVVRGKVHFGWARIKTLGGSFGFPAKLTGYAYETVPNRHIITGKTKGPDVGEQASIATPAPIRKTPSLGELALGSPGISIWRREESVGGEPVSRVA